MVPLSSTRRDAADAPLRLTPRPWRPRPSMLLVGLVLVLASVLGVGALVHSVSGEHAILVMADTVPAGQVITASDLRVLNVSEDTGGLAVIDSSAEASVVGRPAAVTLLAGTPVMAGDLGPAQLPAGEALMGVLVKPGQYPPSLAAGDTVEVIDTGNASEPAPTSPGPPVDATVTAIDLPEDSATSGEIVSLQLDSSDATHLAAAAATGSLTLVLVSAGG